MAQFCEQVQKNIAIPFSPAVIVAILTLKAVISISVLSSWVHLANTKWPESPMLRKKITLLVIFLTRIDRNTWKGGSQDLVNRPTLRKGRLHFDSPTLRKSCRCRSYRPSSACAPNLKVWLNFGWIYLFVIWKVRLQFSSPPTNRAP